MNRRGFIATLTALAGVVLAKIKAPARPKYESAQIMDNLITHYQQVESNGAHYYFTDKHVYICDKNGLHKWTPKR